MSKSNNNEKKEVDIKIILLGESGAGKTNLINTYLGKDFDPNSYPTIDLEDSIKHLEINNTRCIINFWDTMGQEQYRSLTLYASNFNNSLK